MAYLNDILGLLSLRDRYGLERGQLDLGREQLQQQAKQFQDTLGLDREQAAQLANQWQQNFAETQLKRQFEQAQQEEQRRREQDAIQRQVVQQNENNRWAGWQRGADLGKDRNNNLMQLLSGGARGLFGSDQLNEIYKRFGLPGFNPTSGRIP